MLTTGKRELSLEVARKIADRWGYRVGWLTEGELPEKPDTADAELLEEARRAGMQQAYREIREWAVARAVAASEPLSEAVPPVQAEQFFQESEAARADADRAPKGKRRRA